MFGVDRADDLLSLINIVPLKLPSTIQRVQHRSTTVTHSTRKRSNYTFSKKKKSVTRFFLFLEIGSSAAPCGKSQ